MVESSVKCDVCNCTKGETNNWPRVREDANGICILKPQVPHRIGDMDICGAVCLHTLVDRFWSGYAATSRHPEPELTVA